MKAIKFTSLFCTIAILSCVNKKNIEYFTDTPQMCVGRWKIFATQSDPKAPFRWVEVLPSKNNYDFEINADGLVIEKSGYVPLCHSAFAIINRKMFFLNLKDAPIDPIVHILQLNCTNLNKPIYEIAITKIDTLVSESLKIKYIRVR